MHLLLFAILAMTAVVFGVPETCKGLSEEFGVSVVADMLRIAKEQGIEGKAGQVCGTMMSYRKVMEPMLEPTVRNGGVVKKSKGTRGVTYRLECPKECSRNGICSFGTCLCHPAYRGNDCSIESCTGMCSEHGTCKNGKCFCDPGYEGDSCSDEVACPNECNNRGICTLGQCFCHPGYQGSDCSTRTLCPHDCSGKGLCVQGECFCKPGYQGISCNTMKKRCPKGSNHKVCSGNGECNALNGKCTCDPGYEGTACSVTDACPGERSKNGRPCSGHGVCVLGTCHCVDGFKGKDCSSGCPSDCSGNGKCDTGVCRCHEGFKGYDCSARINTVSDEFQVRTLFDTRAMLAKKKENDDVDDSRFQQINTADTAPVPKTGMLFSLILIHLDSATSLFLSCACLSFIAVLAIAYHAGVSPKDMYTHVQQHFS